jgi:dihydrofolate reductase
MITATILVNKEILAHGEASFAQPFACGECVDKYRLTVFPYLTGAGRPLFADATEPHPLELVSSTAFADGMLVLSIADVAEGHGNGGQFTFNQVT